MKALLTFLTLLCAAATASAQAYQAEYTAPVTVYPAEYAGYNTAPAVMPAAPASYVAATAAPAPYAPAPAPALQNNAADKFGYIRSRGKLVCGTDTSLKSYARREDGVWRGIDADICKAVALAVLGDAEKIEMVNINAASVNNALSNGLIDIMLGGVPFRASQEIYGSADTAALIYYDTQLLMTDNADLKPADYQGKKICVASGSDYYRNFQEYASKHGLDVTYLTFDGMDKVKEAFMLKRCQMVTAGALFLSGVKQNMLRSNNKIYSDTISVTPVYAMTAARNSDLREAVRWVVNALVLAEQYGITAQNLGFFAAHNDPEIRNLMGDNPELWQKLGLKPLWLNEAVRTIGNYGEMYERDMGADSDYKLDRGANKLLRDGGLITPLPFI